MRLFFRCGKNFRVAQKQDQSRILAQKFLSCGNLSAGIFHEAYSELSRIALSSTAQVNAARAVQIRCKFSGREENIRCPRRMFPSPLHHVPKNLAVSAVTEGCSL